MRFVWISEQLLHPCAALTDCSYKRDIVFTARYGLDLLDLIQADFHLQRVNLKYYCGVSYRQLHDTCAVSCARQLLVLKKKAIASAQFSPRLAGQSVRNCDK
jgi:hypothetical protein